MELKQCLVRWIKRCHTSDFEQVFVRTLFAGARAGTTTKLFSAVISEDIEECDKGSQSHTPLEANPKGTVGRSELSRLQLGGSISHPLLHIGQAIMSTNYAAKSHANHMNHKDGKRTTRAACHLNFSIQPNLRIKASRPHKHLLGLCTYCLVQRKSLCIIHGGKIIRMDARFWRNAATQQWRRLKQEHGWSGVPDGIAHSPVQATEDPPPHRSWWNSIFTLTVPQHESMQQGSRHLSNSDTHGCRSLGTDSNNNIININNSDPPYRRG